MPPPIPSLKMTLAFVGAVFLFLLGGAGAATAMALHAQAADATLINLAGRQRMLTQRLMWLALTDPGSPAFTDAQQLFAITLQALQTGGVTQDANGQTVTLPPAPDAALRAQLEVVAQTWQVFQPLLLAGDAVQLEQTSAHLLPQLDAVVTAFEARANAKIFQLQLLQTLFLTAALLWLAWGLYLTWQRVLKPLARLEALAEEVAPPTATTDEFARLTQTFDRVRAELTAARDQMETQVARRTRELEAAFELTQEFVAQLDVERLPYSVTERARILTGADAVSLCLLQGEPATLVLAASAGRDVNSAGAPIEQRKVVNDDDLTLRVVQGETMAVEAACVHCKFLQGHAPGACLVAPLRSGQTTLGALCVVRRGGASFDVAEARALTLLANAAALALVNARLAEASKRQAQEAAVLAEREHLAAELHDHLAQTLSFMNLKLDRTREVYAQGHLAEGERDLAQLKKAVNSAYTQVRAALTGLREPPPEAGELAARLQNSMAEFEQLTHLPATLTITDPSALALPALTQAQAVHIVREALSNIRRHAHAQRVHVSVERHNGCAQFAITDDGQGFDPTLVNAQQHLGVSIMRTRAERSGGHLHVTSAPGQGTTVVAEFPLQ